MAANLTTTYASQILDLLGLSKFKGGGQCPPAPPPIKISLHKVHVVFFFCFLDFHNRFFGCLHRRENVSTVETFTAEKTFPPCVKFSTLEKAFFPRCKGKGGNLL